MFWCNVSGWSERLEWLEWSVETKHNSFGQVDEVSCARRKLPPCTANFANFVHSAAPALDVAQIYFQKIYIDDCNVACPKYVTFISRFQHLVNAREANLVCRPLQALTSHEHTFNRMTNTCATSPAPNKQFRNSPKQRALNSQKERSSLKNRGVLSKTEE